MRRSDLISGEIFTALGILISVLTLQFPSPQGGHPGQSLFPRILAILFIFFGVIVIWNGWRPANVKTEESPAEEEAPPNKFNPILWVPSWSKTS